MRTLKTLLAALTAATLLLPGIAGARDAPHWVTAWATSLQVPEEQNALPAEDLTDATLRQIVRVSIGGKTLRVRLTNAFGTDALAISGASIARSLDNATSRIEAKDAARLTFDGKSDVLIPAGAEYWSDPVAMPVAAGADVALTLYLPKAPARQTGHPGSRSTSYFVHGDHVMDAALTDAKTVVHWYQIGAIETDSADTPVLVAFGDSITDGSGTKPDTNRRWTDALLVRTRADRATASLSVVNAGIGGNRLLNDGLGPNALARFDRDVLTAPGVTHLLILEGVNDLGTLTRDAPATADQHAALVERIIAALRQMAMRARAHGITVIGGTIMPYGGSAYYHPDAANEADRAAVNAWIRAPGNMDAVVDFDAIMRDPENPTRLRADVDSGDGLHPSPDGYAAMAAAIPLGLFE